MVPAAWVAGLVLFLAACVPQTSQGTASLLASPSTVVGTPSTAPTPAESPAASPSTSASPMASPSPAKLIIKSLPYHMGEVGVTYGTVVLVAAGGVKPYKWSIQAGALPPGLALSTGGSTTGKPMTVGNFPFAVRVDDSAGAAAGAPSSIMVFRELIFSQTTGWTCSGRVRCALKIPYVGGVPGGKPKVKVTAVLRGLIGTLSLTGGCASKATTSPPPGMTASASGGVMTLSAGPPDFKTWCSYSATVTFTLVDQSPCGAGFVCTSSNTVSVIFNLI